MTVTHIRDFYYVSTGYISGPEVPLVPCDPLCLTHVIDVPFYI